MALGFMAASRPRPVAASMIAVKVSSFFVKVSGGGSFLLGREDRLSVILQYMS